MATSLSVHISVSEWLLLIKENYLEHMMLLISTGYENMQAIHINTNKCSSTLNTLWNHQHLSHHSLVFLYRCLLYYLSGQKVLTSICKQTYKQKEKQSEGDDDIEFNRFHINVTEGCLGHMDA